MFKTKASTIFAYFLFTIFFTIFFALLSACGVGNDNKGNDFGSKEPAPDPLFRSTWRVPADSKTITLPLVQGYEYDFTVDWGDGSPISEITAHDDQDKEHNYANKGDYNLVIEGILEAWSFNNDNTGDKDKIFSVENFGDLGYKNLSGAFHGCANLGAFEGGVTSGVTNLASMFEDATDANPDVSNWDVSSATDMTNLFNSSGLSTANYDAFLINLADNNVSVEDVTLGATGIYYYSDDAKTARDTLESDRGWTITDGGDAALFRSTWRVPENSKTITLPLVDGYNYDFTVNWGDGSSISEITAHNDLDKTHNYTNEGDYNLVIEGTLEAWSFNNTGDKNKILSVESFGDLGYKNLSEAFYGCTNLGAFEGGFTSSVTDMSSMFNSATSANPDVSNWNVSAVTSMLGMFLSAIIADPDVSDWDVSKVTDMSGMFINANSADPDVSSWDVSSVTNMSSMFASANSADPDVSDWDVSSVTNMTAMFSGAIIADPDVSSWVVSSVTNMGSMFFFANSADPDMSSWNVSSVTNMNGMLSGSGLSTANYDAFLINLADNNASVSDVKLVALGIEYSSNDAKMAKDTLESDRGWTITDGGDATP